MGNSWAMKGNMTEKYFLAGIHRFAIKSTEKHSFYLPRITFRDPKQRHGAEFGSAVSTLTDFTPK